MKEAKALTGFWESFLLIKLA